MFRRSFVNRLVGLGFLLAGPFHAASAADNALAKEATERYRAELRALRLDEKDLRLNPGWPLAHTFAAVEEFFGAPQNVPVTGAGWADAAETANTLSDLFALSLAISRLKLPDSDRPRTGSPPLPAACPESLAQPLRQLNAALGASQHLMGRSLRSLSAEGETALYELSEWTGRGDGRLEQDISSRRIRKKYEALASFDQAPMAEAARIVLEAVDAVIARRSAVPPTAGSFRWKTPHGTFLVRGAGDDDYGPNSLDGVAVLIDLGGKNTYHARVADARKGEIRIVIDFGTDVRIETERDQPGGAGSGVLGVGVLALPNAAGTKVLRTGGFSQGAAIGGVGALFINGPAELDADRHVQGAAFFGTGLLLAKNGVGSRYTAFRTGQGAGLSQGVGLFVHSGSSAVIKGGLVQPDPREPAGAISLCQGVGFGHRAYAGGGVGVAVVVGDAVNVEGSYFAQGCGYWHSMGVFRYRGDGGTLQARRYDLGSGVHSAFGHFDLYGSRNRILNWGVGPAFGWDNAVGSALIEGDENEIQAEWGTGTASISSRSFSYLKTNRSRLKLVDFGTGGFFRNQPSYSIQLIEGTDNRLQGLGDGATATGAERMLPKPWGVVRPGQATFVESLGLVPPIWSVLPQEEARNRATVDLQARMAEAPGKTPFEEVADLLDVAAAFSVDKASPREALERLISLPPEKVPHLVDALEPAAVDQLVQLSIALPAHGDVAARAILSRLSAAAPHKKAILVTTLRLFAPSIVMPALLERLSGPNGEANRAAMVRTMGHLVNQDTGEEPGTKAVLTALQRLLERPGRRAPRREAVALLQKVRVAEAMGALCTAADANTEDRLLFFRAAPEDLTERIGERGAEAFIDVVLRDPAAALARVKRELAATTESEPYLRGNMTVLFESTGTADLHSAVVVMGQMGHPHDAAVLVNLLEHPTALVREAAGVALARLGRAGILALKQALQEGPARTRSLVMMAATQAVTAEAAGLILAGLRDPDASVRLSAVSAVKNLPEVLQPVQKKLVARARRRLNREPDPSVRLALQLLPSR